MSGMAINLNNQNKAQQNCMYISWDVLCMEWPQNCVYFVGYTVCGVASVLYDQNKTKHNKTGWIFYRIYFLSKMASNLNNQNKTTHSNNALYFMGYTVCGVASVLYGQKQNKAQPNCVYILWDILHVWSSQWVAHLMDEVGFNGLIHHLFIGYTSQLSGDDHCGKMGHVTWWLLLILLSWYPVV